ncbi:MAG: hypothetical protein NT099_03200 [Candidatus Saganbacteria bacterium]|nr:hypothetical protein [Candidatus Saganbacteria bacterium]
MPRIPGGRYGFSNQVVHRATVDGVQVAAGQRFRGTVAEVRREGQPQGAFVDLGNGLRGLIRGELRFSRGDEVTVQVKKLQRSGPRVLIDLAVVDRLDPKGPPEPQRAIVIGRLGGAHRIEIDQRPYIVLDKFMRSGMSYRPGESFYVLRMGRKVRIGEEELEMCCSESFLGIAERVLTAIKDQTVLEGSFIGARGRSGEYEGAVFAFWPEFGVVYSAESCERIKAKATYLGECNMLLTMQGIDQSSTPWDLVCARADNKPLMAVLVD